MERFFIPKVDNEIAENLSYNLHDPYFDRGWHFGSSDPELWQFKDHIVKPGEKALDLGCGFGRTSLFLGMHGMNVDAYDNNPDAIQRISDVSEAYGFPINPINADILTADFGKELYDTIILGQTFIHFESTEDAYFILEKAYEALKPGGYLWLRAAGKQDYAFEELSNYARFGSYGITKLNDNAIIAPCECSGEYKYDPSLFFDQLELIGYFTAKNMKFIHSQIAPDEEKANIMFGEDWERTSPQYGQKGFITVLVQKR